MPKSNTTAPSRELARLEALDDLAAEAVVAQPGVADAGNQDALHSTNLHFRWEEPEKAAGLAHDLLAGLVDADAEVHSAVVVALDPLDRHSAALEHARLQVGVEAGAYDHLAAAPEDHAVDLHLGQPARRVAHVGGWLRRLARHGSRSSRGRAA